MYHIYLVVDVVKVDNAHPDTTIIEAQSVPPYNNREDAIKRARQYFPGKRFLIVESI